MLKSSRGQSYVLHLHTAGGLDSCDGSGMPHIFYLGKAICATHSHGGGCFRVPKEQEHTQDQGREDMWHGAYLWEPW